MKSQLQTKIEFDHEKVKLAGDWALEISKALGADCYINPSSGRCLFDEREFLDSGIDICYFDVNCNPFVENQSPNRQYSIIDSMLHFSPSEILTLAAECSCILTPEKFKLAEL